MIMIARTWRAYGDHSPDHAATGASARVVCNENGDCWHAKRDCALDPEFKLSVHAENWTGKRASMKAKGYWRGKRWKDL
jgi:hypothetical protein